MKAIRKTKRPTLVQMQNMASNLQDKYKRSAMVEVSAWSHAIESSRATYLKYRIWVDLTPSSSKDAVDWGTCFDFYKKLMEIKI